MLSVCLGSCLEKIKNLRPQALSFRIRLSWMLQTLAVLIVVCTFVSILFYYSDYLQMQQKMIDAIQSNIESPETLSCKQPSSIHPKFVPYSETELEEKALSMMNKEMWSDVKPAMTSAERLTVHELLKEFVKICNLFNITDYFLFSGSLLGSYRHHGLQPWDDDIDILMRYSDQKRIVDAFKKYVNQSHEVDAVFMLTRLKLFHRRGSFAIRQFAHRWPFLDMSFYYENETHIWEFRIYKLKMYHIIEKSLIFPLHLRPFEAVMINSPRDAYAVLKLLYRDSGCVPLTWIHRMERRPPRNVTRFDCAKVAPIYPWVHRKAVGPCMEEALWVNDSLLYTVSIEEPTYAVTEPYKLELNTLDSSNSSVS